MLRCWVALLCVLVVAGFAPPARAEVRIDVDDATGCLDASLLATVSDVIGRDLASSGASLTLSVIARGASVELRVHDEAGATIANRTLEGAPRGCAARRGAVAIVAAVLLDDRTSTTPLDVSTAVIESEAPIEEAPVAAIPIPEPVSARGPHVRFEIAALGSYAWLPELAAGGRLRGVLVLEGWGLGFGTELYPAFRTGLDVGVDVLATSGFLDVESPALSAGPVHFSGALRVLVGALRGVGFGAETNFERLEPILRFDAAARLALTITPGFAIVLEGALLVSAARPSFSARIAGERVVLHEPSVLAPMLALGLVFSSD